FPPSLPFVPIALVTVIFLHIIVAVVYYTSRTKGCTLVNSEQQLQNNQALDITAHRGGSVLLPCSCTDLQTKPEEFSWKKDKQNTQTWEEISRESDQYRNRVQLFNDSSPGNLSLLISHLTEEDGGDYECAVKDSYIFIRLTVKGCTLENRGQQRITAHTGGSVLLPCSCPDLQTKPEEFSWKKENRNTQINENISRESGQYRNRVQLFNDHSPGNLSLLISHLTEEDGGVYQCAVKGSHMIIRLTVKGNSVSVISFSLIPVLLLLMVLGGVIYWRYRGRRQGQTESREQQQTEREQKSQDDVTYSTIVLSRTPAAPTVIGIEDKAEYAVLKKGRENNEYEVHMTSPYLAASCVQLFTKQETAALWRTVHNDYRLSQHIQEGQYCCPAPALTYRPNLRISPGRKKTERHRQGKRYPGRVDVQEDSGEH
ncbi:hypothetical protein NFI96_009749, partial [Prochilodus magdalenae]